MTPVLTRWRTTRGAEHATAEEVRHSGVVSAATHFSTESPAVLVTIADVSGTITVLGSDDPDEQDELRGRHLLQTSGRLFAFPGGEALQGRTSVARLLDLSAVDEVRLVGSPAPVEPAVVVDTQGFVRPTMQDGLVRLVLRPAADGVLVPFEQSNPTPCCADL